MHRLRAILYKEFIQIRRDTMMLRLLIFLPLIQILIFGFAINTDVKHLPTIVFDQCRQEESREILDVLTATGYYNITTVANSIAEVNDAIQSGQAVVGIIFPPDMVKEMKHGRAAQIQFIVDASDVNSATSAMNTAQLTVQQKSAQRLSSLGGNTYLTGTYELRIRPWYNPDFVSSYNIIPGIMGLILTMTLVLMASMSIVREKEEGTLEQLLITPLRPWELMLGKIIPYLLLGYVQITIALFLGKVLFEVPFVGSLPLFYGLSTVFMLAMLSLGILISTVSQNQMQAMQLSIFLILPSILLSGFMFPRLAMPTIFYYASFAIPMTHYLQIARGIFLKGSTLAYLYEPLTWLALITILTLGLSIWRFQKTYHT